MVLLELMWTFIKIGFASFGGMAMVPLINEEMLAHGWMGMQEVMDIVAIAEMTPGSLGLNCATFVGIRVAGIWGALVPTLTLCFAAAVFIEHFKEHHYIESALYGIRPASLDMLLATAVLLVQENYLAGQSVLWSSLPIGGISCLLLWKSKFCVPRLICVSAVLGLLLVRWLWFPRCSCKALDGKLKRQFPPIPEKWIKYTEFALLKSTNKTQICILHVKTKNSS